MKHEKVYLLTDGCAWEINKQTGNEHPHAVEVVDLETGAVRYIKSGSRIAFLEGEITDIRTQETYNQKGQTVPLNRKRVSHRAGRKTDSSKNEQQVSQDQSV